jgi:hypothetical protein
MWPRIRDRQWMFRKWGRLRDDDRTSALLILASSVDPNLASTCDRVVLSSNDPQPHDQAQRHSEGG